jgi:hypothetical protein
MFLNSLTTLASVKNWVGVSTTNDDALLTQLISDTSRFILSYLQRPTLYSYLFSDVYDGTGGRRLLLRHWPVLSVSLVMVDDVTIPVLAAPPGLGFVLEPWDGFPPGRPQALSLCGYEFFRGYSNVSITYTTGFVVSGEVQTVPASLPYTITVNAPQGSWGVDQGVAYANGVPLTLVASNPIAGQYTAAAGMYGFSSGDAGAGVLISYSYVPADVEHACIVMVGERYRYRGRIGEVSKSLGGQETMAFSQKDMPDFVRTLLQPYRRVVPG